MAVTNGVSERICISILATGTTDLHFAGLASGFETPPQSEQGQPCAGHADAFAQLAGYVSRIATGRGDFETIPTSRRFSPGL